MIEKGKIEISETFKISGRGIVLAGIIIEGQINTGDFIQFEYNGESMKKRIIGLDRGKKENGSKLKVGILINCENEVEMEKFHEWNPKLTLGKVFQGQ